MYKVIAIDEAGRGPVIGSMFVACAIIVLEKKEDLDSYQQHLVSLGVKDSKALSPKKRNEVYEKLKENMDVKYLQITPATIDLQLGKGKTINELEVNGIVSILEAEKPQYVMLDALTANPKKFGEELKARLSFDCEILSENKADANHPFVAAASIVAKELREEELRQIKENLCIDCGSGYPSDAVTVAFLKKHWLNKEYAFLFRKSWKSYQNLVKQYEKKIHDFIDEEL